MRRFELVRQADPSGVSGTGVVAHGVQFADGTVVMRWTCSRPATSVWASVDDLITIHGHNGSTVVRWLDSSANGQPDRAGQRYRAEDIPRPPERQ